MDNTSSYRQVTIGGITCYARERTIAERYSQRKRKLLLKRVLSLLEDVCVYACVGIVVAIVAFSVVRIWGIAFGTVLASW